MSDAAHSLTFYSPGLPVFTLLAYNPDAYSGRGILKFKNETTSKELYAYQSKSEIGFWRVCIEDSSDGQLLKGH